MFAGIIHAECDSRHTQALGLRLPGPGCRSRYRLHVREVNSGPDKPQGRRPTRKATVAQASSASRASATRTRRDRHGRRYRGPLAWPPTPSMPSRMAFFDQTVLAAVEECERRWGTDLRHIEVCVEDVPPSDPSAWEEAVPLGRSFPPQGKLRARMVVYRLPITTRAGSNAELEALVLHVVRTQLAVLTGRDLDDEDLE